MQLLKNMIEIFTSKHFMKLLKDYTNQSILSYAKLEIQKWEAGCYTVCDSCEYEKFLLLNTSSW